MKHMSPRFNLPPGVTINDIEGDPEGFFEINGHLLVMGDNRMIQVQTSATGDFLKDEHMIDLTPREARLLATTILKIVNGELSADGREIGPEETYKLVFGIDPAQEGAEATVIILGKPQPPDPIDVILPPVSREILEDMQNLKTAIMEMDGANPNTQILLHELYLRLAQSMKIHKPPRINSDLPPARVFHIYPKELAGFETGFMGEDEPNLATEVERLKNLNAELVGALEAMQEGFIKGEIRFTKKRQSDKDPYHPANTKMCAALARARGDDDLYPPAA